MHGIPQSRQIAHLDYGQAMRTALVSRADRLVLTTIHRQLYPGKRMVLTGALLRVVWQLC